jgi:ATP-dependent Zn protease
MSKKLTAKQRRLKTATHEAGHAVVYRVLDIPVRYASIKQNGDILGEVAPVLSDDKNEPEKEAMACFAGAMAETELLGIKGQMSVDDRFRVEVSIGELFGNGLIGSSSQFKTRCKKHHTLLEREARKLVHQHRDVIARVAKALMKRERLSGKQLDKIIAGLQPLP